MQGLSKALLILFRVPDITDSEQGLHFTSQNTQCWAYKQGIQQNVHLASQGSYWSQAAELIEHHNGLL